MENKTKVALIGHGFLGKWHAQKLNSHQNINFLAIIESRQEIHDEIKKNYPHVRVVLQLEEVINDIDAAVISTPTSSHFHLVQTLLAKGIHVFCEKPLIQNLTQADQIKKSYLAAKEIYPNLILQVGHSERCHAIWPRVLPYFENKKMSRFSSFVRKGAFKNRATDVSVVEDLMIHDIDLALMLTRALPIRVQAVGQKLKTNQYDEVHAILDFPHHQRISIMASRVQFIDERLMNMVSAEASIQVDMKNLVFSVTDASTTEILTQDQYEKRDHLMVQQQDFFHSIINHVKPKVSLEEGLAPIKIMSAIIESCDHFGANINLQYD
jgi:predicted dehydrogenase